MGTIFIRNGIPLPGDFGFRLEHWGGWDKLLDADAATVEGVVSRAGWHFIIVSGLLNRKAFGFANNFALNRALQRIIRAVNRRNFNSFEITRVANHRIGGVFLADVWAYPRQLRPNPFIRDLDPYYYSSDVLEFHRLHRQASQKTPQVTGI